MPMKITYKGKKGFAVNIRNHTFNVDQPEDNGGDDRGPTPPEIFAASLGTCVGVYVTTYCNAKGINCEGVSLDVNWKFSGGHESIDNISVNIIMPDESYKIREKAILRAAERCLIDNTLKRNPQVDVALNIKT